MKNTVFFSLSVLLASCTASHDPVEQTTSTPPVRHQRDTLSAAERHFLLYKDRTGSSISSGTVSNGSLSNGYILPFSGKNFHYFDTNSYLHNRCFVNLLVKQTLLAAYRELETTTPDRYYGIMECSNENGGRIVPHRTHRNGLSVDFMTPLLKDGKPYTDLDFIGAPHYLMDFDATGHYKEDPAVSIDFRTMAQHLLAIIAAAKNNGLSVEKIIWKTELRDELFATDAGKQLQATGVYMTRKLHPLINVLHDDHYHVDFKPL